MIFKHRYFPTAYLVFLPAVIIAATVLAYLTYKTAQQQAKLGQRSIVSSTLALVHDKVDQLERQIIDEDNSVFQLVQLSDTAELEREFLQFTAESQSTITELYVLDSHQKKVVSFSVTSQRQERRILKVLTHALLPKLQTAELPLESLRHLHEKVAGSEHLFSYLVREHLDERYLIVAHHNTQLVMSQTFAKLFVSKNNLQLYNVVDETDHRVYGDNLAMAGEYIVGRRFPTTLYRWRLQVAPAQASQLSEERRFNQYGSILLLFVSFGVILFGVAFILIAAIKEKRLVDLRTEFIGNVSHELKTPLSIIRMYAEILASGRFADEEKQKTYIEMVHRESERLSSLVENVLDFSALDQESQQYVMHPIQVADTVAQSVQTFRDRLRQESREISLDVPQEPPLIKADEHAITLAITNLIDNAVKYGEGTPITVRLETQGEELSISVRDRGRGITPENEKRIFQRFFRGDNHRPIRGSGIGLSLVEHIATAHGGRVWAGTHPNGGAIVGFSIAIVRS